MAFTTGPMIHRYRVSLGFPSPPMFGEGMPMRMRYLRLLQIRRGLMRHSGALPAEDTTISLWHRLHSALVPTISQA